MDMIASNHLPDNFQIGVYMKNNLVKISDNTPCQVPCPFKKNWFSSFLFCKHSKHFDLVIYFIIFI